MTPRETMRVTDATSSASIAGYRIGDGSCNFVVFSGPQLSLFEMKRLAELFDGRRVHPGTRCFVTTSNGVLSARASALGYAQRSKPPA